MIAEYLEPSGRSLLFKELDSLGQQDYQYYALPSFLLPIDADTSSERIIEIIKFHRITRVIIVDKYVDELFWDNNKALFQRIGNRDVYICDVTISDGDVVIQERQTQSSRDLRG